MASFKRQIQNDHSDLKAALKGYLVKIAKEYLNGPDYKELFTRLIAMGDQLVTLIAVVLMTKSTNPVPEALGYTGVEQKSEFYRTNFNSKLFQTDQSIETSKLPKDVQDKYPTYIDRYGVKRSMLCIDHSAMLFPSKEMFEWMYKATLFGTMIDGAGFDTFGSYDMDAVKQQNMQGLGQQQTGGTTGEDNI